MQKKKTYLRNKKDVFTFTFNFISEAQPAYFSVLKLNMPLFK